MGGTRGRHCKRHNGIEKRDLSKRFDANPMNHTDRVFFLQSPNFELSLFRTRLIKRTPYVGWMRWINIQGWTQRYEIKPQKHWKPRNQKCLGTKGRVDIDNTFPGWTSTSGSTSTLAGSNWRTWASMDGSSERMRSIAWDSYTIWSRRQKGKLDRRNLEPAHIDFKANTRTQNLVQTFLSTYPLGI